MSETRPVIDPMQTTKVGFGPTLVYAATIFLSAFLLFQVQPLIGKVILPWFGGSPAVWTAAMLFFQTTLFGGYLYAHVMTSRLSSQSQVRLHLGLLAIAVVVVAFTQITPWSGLRPTGNDGESPLLQVLMVLCASVGLPYFLLSSTGPLLQKWFSDAFPGASPYRLFALSNFGSLLALLSFPFFFEVYWNSNTQARVWSAAFIVFSLASAACALRTRKKVAELDRSNVDVELRGSIAKASSNSSSINRALPTDVAPSLATRLAWIGLPALASVMYLAITNEVCQNVATVPLLWIIPLSLYLLSFIVAFDHPRWFRMGTTAILLCISIIVVASWRHLDSHIIDLILNMKWQSARPWMFKTAAYFLALFLVCLLCHGQLARLKPTPKYLTSYFMTMSLGGAVGGLFVNLVATRVFVTFLELPLAFLLSVLVAGYLLQRRLATFQPLRWFAIPGTLVLVGGALYALAREEVFRPRNLSKEVVHRSRNFYGVLSVRKEDLGTADESFRFFSGRVLHGMQLTDPSRRAEPLTYFGPRSGVALAITELQKREPECHIGIVGLGIGTLSAYARPSDRVRYYEINPAVVSIASNRDWFRFLSDGQGDIQIILGDARLRLENELQQQGSQKFDLLCLDAFSGDAIPTHLLTDEAFALYRKHLKSDGVLVVHITNTYLNLYPIVQKLAAKHGWTAIRIFRREDGLQDINDYALLSDDETLVTRFQEWAVDTPPSPPLQQIPLWTDQYSNLLQILR